MQAAEDVLAFWLDEVGPKGWYAQDDDLDARVRDRFMTTWSEAAAGGLSLWMTHPNGALAYTILTDQFPRNMFRDDARAYSTDPLALAVSKLAIGKGWDLRIEEPARQFFYLPMMHAESLADQERCVRLMKTRMPASGAENLLHARAHREVIRRFGRFPHRNAALGRRSQPQEKAFIEGGGYGRAVQNLRAMAT